MRNIRATKLFEFALALSAAAGLSTAAQTFTPPAAATSSQITLLGGLTQTQALAVDSAGDVFYTLAASGILNELPANGGAPITLYTGAAYPKGVAANNTYVYLSDYNGHLWQIAIAGGAATDVLSACGTLDGYYLGAQEVAIDGQGNVYVGGNNSGNNKSSLYKITSAGVCSIVPGVTVDANTHIAADAVGNLAYSTGGVLYSLPVTATTPVVVPGSYGSIIGLRADAAGDIFVNSYSSTIEVPFLGGALAGAQAFTVFPGGSQNDVAIGVDGSIYTTDGTNLYKNLIGKVRFSATAVNTPSAAQTVNVVFNSAQTLTSISYLSGTAASAEIASAGTGSCATGQAYAAGATCTLALTFTPQAIGARNGAVVLASATGPVGRVFVAGQGSGAGLVVDPGTQTTLGTTWQAPSGIAVGPNGAVLVADRTAGTLSYIPAGSTTPTVIATGLTQPSGAAVAADGTAYVATSAGGLVQVPFVNSAYGTAQTVATGLNAPSSVAVGPDGSVYVANTGAGAVVRFPNQGGSVNFETLPTVGTGFVAPTGLAFDASGNLYVSDSSSGSIYQVTPTNTTTSVVTALAAPIAVAIDDSRGLYVLQSGVATVLHIAYSNGSYGTNTTTSLGLGLTTPVSLAADSAGDLYLADSGAPAVVFIQRTAGSLNLGKINEGLSSTAQSLLFSNDGDLSLTFGSPLYTASGDTGDFSVTTSSSNSCAANGVLSVGSNCGINGIFTPTTTGALSEALAINSNSATAGVTGSFTGTGTNLPKTSLVLTTDPSGTVSYGTSITANAVVTPVIASSTAPTGTVTFFVNGIAYATKNLASGSASATITGLTAGSDTIDASYNGDNNYAASSGTTQTVVVTLAPTSTTFTSSISSTTPVAPGSSVTLSATVTSAVQSTKPTGKVNFVSNGTTLVSAPLNTSTGVATVTTTSLPNGIYTITAVYSGDTGFATSSSAGIAVAIRPQQYDILNTPTALTVNAPGSVSTTFNVAPISGYTGGIDMACSGLPANTQCSFSPSVVFFTGANNTPQPIVLTITTDTAPPTTVAGWLLPFGMLLLFGAWRKRRSLGAVLTLVLALAISAAAVSVSGCSSANLPLTPKGSSTVTVTLTGTPNGVVTAPPYTGANIVKTFTFTVTVQ